MTGIHAPAIDRFWAKVNKDGPVPAHRPDLGPCWLWTGATGSTGYARFRPETRRLVNGHRWAYEELVATVAPALVVDHLCRVPACVNPAHMEPVTQRENCLRGTSPAARHALVTHCPLGHAYTADNTYITARGGRQCRACDRNWGRQRYYERQGIAYEIQADGTVVGQVRRTHCKHGHPLDEANTRVRRTPGREGNRECWTCRRIGRQAYWAKRAARLTVAV